MCILTSFNKWRKQGNQTLNIINWGAESAIESTSLELATFIGPLGTTASSFCGDLIPEAGGGNLLLVISQDYHGGGMNSEVEIPLWGTSPEEVKVVQVESLLPWRMCSGSQDDTMKERCLTWEKDQIG